MEENWIIIKGAREHNLKNINVKIPRNKIVVITGLSGSGKSSLAFDTIYAEGQRRYVESLSTYARQFLEQLQKPDVEHIEGLSPAIAIEQRSSSGSPRSIVGTQTEIYDYLRLLFARVGTPYCYKCGRPILAQSVDEIVNNIFSYPQGSRIYILAPLVRGKKGKYKELFLRLKKDGFVRIKIDGKIYSLDEEIDLQRYKLHDIDVVIDRVLLNPFNRSRISSSVETALSLARGLVIIQQEGKSGELFNTNFWCPNCKVGIPELEPRIFSFNSPYGACEACNGLGTKLEFDPDLIIPDKRKTLQEGAIEVWKRGGRGYILYYRRLLRELSYQMGFSMEVPFYRLPRKIQKTILYGAVDIEIWGRRFEGVIPHLQRLFNTTESEYLKSEISKFMSAQACTLCKGQRLKKESLSVYINRKNIWDIMRMSIIEAYEFFENLKLSKAREEIAHHIIKEIKNRLKFCILVGLDYLTLDRLSSTLSGGEAQRIRLATQVGSALSGVIYVLDEPTIGLHQRDTSRLINIFKDLRNLGNTLIVVEHDEQVITSSDWIIDLGPGAGKEGGRVVYSGVTSQLFETKSLTASYLKGEKKIEIPLRRNYKNRPFLLIKGARCHNLKNIDVKIPLGVFVCVTGVSGSGKSTLVEEILYKGLAKYLYHSYEKPGRHDALIGKELIDKVIVVDQSPIGRTPRSNPATYTGVFTYIRELFSRLPQARTRGYKPARFSFNVKGGRCEACEGDGIKRIDMHFLPSVYVKCEVCGGKRFNEQTLEVKFKGYSISDVLEMSVDEAFFLFKNIPAIENILGTLKDVGLGYIALGQSATTLSGGEAQRIKLSKFLRRRSTGKTLYLLDEPTTGLHFEDVRKLLGVLQRLVDKGNTVLVIEHNLEVIKCADYIVDLGPEGGEKGGYLVGCGSPEEIVEIKTSYTGKYLRSKIKR